MSEFPAHPVPANFNDAIIDSEKYNSMYRQSLAEPDQFWGFLYPDGGV